MPLQMQAEMHPVPPPHGYDGNGYEDYAYAPWFVRAENSRFYRSLDRGGRIHRSDMGWHRPTLLSDDTNNIDTLRYTAPPPVANQERGRLRASSELSPPAQYSTKATPLTTTPSTPISPTLTEARRPLSPSNSLLHRHRHHRQYSTDDSARRRPNPHPDGSQTLHHPSRTTSAAMRSTNNSSTTNGRVGGSRSSSRPAAPELAAVDFDYRRLLRPVKRMPAVNKPAPPPPSHSSRPISNYADYRRPHLPTTTTPYDWPIMENDAPAYC
uniref:Uncharacterized protein n=1 Tax=Plectus sambesii TaxID=2011161 RepID=A0A914UTS2_9BILA